MAPIITTDFKEFCNQLFERWNDLKHQIRFTISSLEIERNILKKYANLNDREKKTIRNYIAKLEMELVGLIEAITELQKLQSSKKLTMKKFKTNKNQLKCAFMAPL